ncbi:MAG: acyl-CoA dehydrogenase domain protein [Frankiales bacterium]|nr:acyl-CoA dehydrogenase domain protein [Frankiales bacterium]
MYFGLPDDALALREGLREVLATACTPAVIRAAWDGDPCDALWKTLGEFGVLGLLVPEERGGLGLDELSFVAAMEESGWHGVPGPLVETVAYLPTLELPADGSARIAVHRSNPVPHAAVATHVIGATAQQPGLRAETVDRSRHAAHVPGEPAPDSPASLLATLGTAAFLLGLARRQLDLTVSYVKDRKQFGVPIGTFQAIKHPLADAVVGTEFAWPAVLRAARSLIDADPLATVHVSMAKALASDAAYRMSRVCLQAHGAMGYTVEYDLHLFAKRTWAMAKDWGTASEHRKTIARELL